MPRLRSSWAAGGAAVAAFCLASTVLAARQQLPGAATGGPFTIAQVLSYPFPSDLVASPVGSTIAWVFDEQGVRNIWVAAGPAFAPHRLTAYQQDDGQEITNLAFSDDGRWIVFVRGGDHDSNWE